MRKARTRNGLMVGPQSDSRGEGSPETPHPCRDEIEAQQLRQLNSLLETLASGNEFYQRKLGSALRVRYDSVSAFLREVPFTTKEDLRLDQSDHPPYGTNLSFPLSSYTRYNQTSASTGAPLRWLDTPDSWRWMLDNWGVVLRASGVRPSDRVLFTFSFGPFLGFWTAFEAAVRLGCLCIPGGGLSTRARLRTALDNRVSVVCCTPTYALRLGQVAEEEGVDLGATEVRKMLTAGEPGGCIPSTRKEIEKLWQGVRIADHHGMTEVGPVSFECSHRPGVLHVIESAYIAEIVDPEGGRPAAQSEEGELILTPLGRDASPLLRYKTGDLVKGAREAPCACGRYDLALEGGILGRLDDMVCIRGVNLHPAAVEEVIRSLQGVAEYQVQLQDRSGLPEIRVRLEPSPDVADPALLATRLAQRFRDHFALRIPVDVATAGSLPRFEMKARRWIRPDRQGR